MKLTPNQLDTLKELINIGVGRAAGMLNDMLQTHVHLQVPYVKVYSSSIVVQQEMIKLGAEKISAVRLAFKGPFSGSASLVFPSDSAAKLVDILTGEKMGTFDFDSIRIGTLTEVGNIILNAVMGSIGNVLAQHIDYSIPTYREDTIVNLLQSNNIDLSRTILLAHTHFQVKEFQIEGDIILLFEVGSFDTLLNAIDITNAKIGLESNLE